MRVLVTGTTLFFSRILIQKFAEHGAEVTAADNRLISTGKMSRFTSNRVKLPPLTQQPERYLQALLEELKTGYYDLLVPSFEETLLVSQFQREIRKHTALNVSPFDVIMSLHHKPSLYRLCDQIGIPAPASVSLQSLQELEAAIPLLRFPVLVKMPLGNNSAGLQRADDGDGLKRLLESHLRGGVLPPQDRPLVQEQVDGQTIFTLMYCQNGKKLGEVVYTPLRTYPARFGTGAHRQTLENPKISELTSRLAEATGWTGFLGLDFLIDRETGTPWIIDANPRANPATGLGVICGIDWAQLQLDAITGKASVTKSATAGARDRSWPLDFAWLLDDRVYDRRWFTRFGARLRELLSMRKHLTPTNGILKSDLTGELGLAWQVFRAIVESAFSNDTPGLRILHDANFPVNYVQAPEVPGTVRRFSPASMDHVAIPAPHFPAVPSRAWDRSHAKR